MFTHRVVGWRHRSRLLLLALICAAVALAGVGSDRASAAQTKKKSVADVLSRSKVTDGRVGGLWVAISKVPSEAEVVQGAKRYDVVILNAWDTANARLLKQLNPSIIVLVYKDLASSRSYAVHDGRDDTFIPTGVGYAAAKPGWFATDAHGDRVQWGPYPGHWQMQVWNPDYQAQWVANVEREVGQSTLWDGVFADNDMAKLKSYSSALLGGTTTSEQSDALLRSGLDTLVAKAGKALNADGKLIVPNLSDGRLDLDRWHSTAQYGGAMDEHFAHWGRSADTGYATTWGPSGWDGQASELNVGLSLLISHAGAGDEMGLRYGYATALIRATGRVVWTAETDETFRTPEWFPWQGINLGAPRSAGVRDSSGVWRRLFANGLVVLNPSDKPVTSTAVRTGLCGLNHKTAPRFVKVAPHDAQLLVTKATGAKAC